MAISASDPAITSTGLREIITNLAKADQQKNATTSQPNSVNAAQLISSVLIPNLMIMLAPQDDKTTSIDSVDVLIEVLRHFGKKLKGVEVEQFQVKVMAILENDRTPGVVKKRAVIALSFLCLHSPDTLLAAYISHLIELFRIEGTSPQRIRLYVSITGALARTIPERFGPYLKTLAPFILSLVDGKDLEDEDNEPNVEGDEVREAALLALEAFQNNCVSEMRRFTEEVLNAGKIFLKYDPNYADQDESDDEDMDEDEDDGFGDDADFEEDGNFSDEDDISWKVRRCAAKLLSTVIRTRASDLLEDGTLYREVAPALIDRFSEREENVRLEVLATATVLVRKTGDIAPQIPAAVNRKRRRESSSSNLIEGMMDDRSPTPVNQSNGPRASLASLVPKITKATSKHLRGKKTTLPTKQASVVLLRFIVEVLQGGLDDVLSQFMEPIIDIAKGGSAYLPGGAHSSGANVLSSVSGASNAASATASSLRIEVLKLIAKIYSGHNRKVIEQYLDSLVPAIIAAIKDKFYKISSQALSTSVEIIKHLTSEGVKPSSGHLSELYEAIIEKVGSAESDYEVRETAMYGLAVILSRTTSSSPAISSPQRQAGLDILLERLRNETTRIPAARAIDIVAKNAKSVDDLNADWVGSVVTELAGQLRKSNRSLRGASLDGLKSIVANEYGLKLLSAQARNELVGVLSPLLTVNDLHLLGPALVILKGLIETKEVSVTQPLVNAICGLVKTHQGTGSTLNNIVHLVNVIGEVDNEGKKMLMNGLLKDVGVFGETAVVAKVIGNLVVSGGGSEGGLSVGVQDFVTEINVATDDHRICLALMVLGEAGLKM